MCENFSRVYPEPEEEEELGLVWSADPAGASGLVLNTLEKGAKTMTPLV